MEQSYYPPLSALVGIDEFPSELEFLQGALDELLKRTYFKDLQFSKSRKGGRGFYSLTLVRYDKIGFTIPGTEILIGLDRVGNARETHIPVTLSYEWGILDLVAGFSPSGFLDDALGMMSVIANSTRVDLKKVLRETVGRLVHVPEDVTDFIDDLRTFVGVVNTAFPATLEFPDIPLPTDALDATLDDLIAEIEDKAQLPMLEVIYGLYVATASNPAQMLDRVEQIFSSVFNGKSLIEYIKSLMIPKIDASLHGDLSITFPPEILKPAVKNTTTQRWELDTTPGAQAKILLGGIDFLFSTEKGIGLEGNLAASMAAQIGDTGFFIAFSDFRLDLSTKTNVPEATADGRGPDFVGVFIKEAELGLPTAWETESGNQVKVIGKNLLIGTGGLSGSFGLVGTGGQSVLHFTIGSAGDRSAGFGISLTRFDIRFHQGSIVDSNIVGTLSIPGYTGTIDIKVSIHKDGFDIAATGTGFSFGIPNIFTFTVTSLSIGERNGLYYIGTSGFLTVDAKIPGTTTPFIEQRIEIKKLLVWSNGQIEVEGGSITLPKAVSFKAGPVELAVTAFHIGAHEGMLGAQLRKYKYFGFDGGLDTGSGGVDARGEGIKYYFTVDGGTFHHYLRIESISVDITIPGDATPETAAVILKGFLSMKNSEQGDDGRRQYTGTVSLSLPKLSISGGAGMKLSPDTGSFLVDANLNLSSPILLGSTGLGIYGFRGLLGHRYVASKESVGLTKDDAWFEYYRKPERGVTVKKFSEQDGFSFGAGVSLATAADSGTIFSSKLFFLLSIPELFILEGQAAILSERVGLDTINDPPFYAGILISRDSVEAFFGVNYFLPSSGPWKGDIATVDARMELAFFFARSNAWYLNIGRDTPQNQRIQARILQLLDMYAYFMLSSTGIKAGAGASWKFEKDFSVAKVGVGASVDMGAELSFRPVQLGGFYKIRGYAELKVFGIGFRLDVNAELKGEAPNPFIISGSFGLKIKTPWPLPDVNISVGLTWVIRSAPDLSEVGMATVRHYVSRDEYRQDPKVAAKGVHMLTGENFPLNFYNNPFTPNQQGRPLHVGIENIPLPSDSAWLVPAGEGALNTFDNTVIPVDTYVDFEFTKGVIDTPAITAIARIPDTAIGTELIPPKKGYSPQVQHKYIVKNVQIAYFKPASPSTPDVGAWAEYKLEELNTPLILMVQEWTGADYATARNVVAKAARHGYWQMTQANTFSKLRVLGRTPLEHGADSSPIDLGFPKSVLICPPEPIPKVCQNWKESALGKIADGGERKLDRKLSFQVTPDQADVVEFTNIFGIGRSVLIKRRNRLEIWLPVATSNVTLKLTTLTEKVKISYYRGYPWAPPVAEESGGSGGSGGGSGVPPSSWDAVPDTPSVSVTPLDYWTKLKSAAGYKRLICVESASPDIGSGSGGAIRALVEKFTLTHAYLRQLLGLSDAIGVEEPVMTVADLCARLTQMLETLTIGLTGKDPIPPVLQPHADHFFVELAGYIEEYRRYETHDVVFNTATREANDFYEGWMGLISCLGRLLESRSSLPAAVQNRVARSVDPVLAHLYATMLDVAGGAGYDLELNPVTWHTDPLGQLKSIAGFFGLLSLDFAKIGTSGAIATFDRFFLTLDTAYRNIVRAMRGAGKKTCGMQGCDVTRDVVQIARTLGLQTLTSGLSPAVDKLWTLLNGAEDSVTDLLGAIGWDSAPVSGNTAKLRRALTAIVVSYSLYDELPFRLRYRLDKLYYELGLIIEEFREDIKGTTPTLDPEADAFITNWTNALSCLCRLCWETGNLSQPDRTALEAALSAHADGPLGTMFSDITTEVLGGLSEVPEERLVVAGTSVPADLGGKVRMLMNFFAAAMTECGSIPTQVQTLLAGYYPTSEYAAVTAALGSTYDHCSGIPTGTCADVIGYFELFKALRLRSAEIPESIAESLEETFLPEVESIYRIVFNTPAPAAIVPAPGVEPMVWMLDEVLDYFYGICLSSTSIPPSIESAISGTLMTIGMDLFWLRQSQDYQNADFAGVDTCDWFISTADVYRTYCIAPPVTLSPAMITRIHDFNATLLSITDAVGLPAVDTTTVAADSCAVIGPMLRSLLIASGEADLLTVVQLAEMKKLVKAMRDANPGPRTIPAGSCTEDCSDWLTMLACLCTVTRHAGRFPSLDASVELAIDGALGEALGRVLLVSDELGIEFVPNRRTSDRCHRVRAVANYLGVMSLDYGAIDPDVIDFFPDLADLLDGLETTGAEGLKPFRDAICINTPGPYDPLMKRVTLQSWELLREVVYVAENGDKWVDRIVIEPDADCPNTTPANWPQSYWGSVAQSITADLLGAIEDEKLDVQTQLSSAPADSELEHELTVRLADLVAERTRALAFRTFAEAEALNSSSPALPLCATYLEEVCWLPPAVFDYNLNLPPYSVVKKVANDMQEALSKMNQPIWRPNTRYAIKVTMREELNRDGVAYDSELIFGFKTAGPLGHFHQLGNGTPRADYLSLYNADREQEYKYALLRGYIDFERSYPAPDGNLVNAKPLYFNDTKLSLFFTKDYISSMYSTWGWAGGGSNPFKYFYSALELVIKDPASGIATDPISLIAQWVKETAPRASKAFQTFQNILKNSRVAGKQCISITETPVPPTMNVAMPLPADLDLQPEKLYTAIYNALYNEVTTDPAVTVPVSGTVRHEVHRHVFKTSRYAGFVQHIESYLTADAIIYHTADQPGAITTARDLVQELNQTDPASVALAQKYPVRYERLIEGILELKGWEEPVTTEFRVIVDDASGDVLGIAARSPEPFNDPRMPASVLNDTIAISGVAAGDTRLLFSKDGAKVFITNQAMSLPSAGVDLTFTFWEFDGKEYVRATGNPATPGGAAPQIPAVIVSIPPVP